MPSSQINPVNSILPRPSGHLAGQLLVASPDLKDERFEKSIVFLCGYDAKGAMGIVINQTIENLTLNKLFERKKINTDIPNDHPVHYGGPLDEGRIFVIHSTDYRHTGSLHVHPSFAITATLDILSDIVQGQGPRHILLALGYAEWEPGQLDEEIHTNLWLPMQATEEQVFITPSQKKWSTSIAKLGLTDLTFSGEAANA